MSRTRDKPMSNGDCSQTKPTATCDNHHHLLERYLERITHISEAAYTFCKQIIPLNGMVSFFLGPSLSPSIRRAPRHVICSARDCLFARSLCEMLPVLSSHSIKPPGFQRSCRRYYCSCSVPWALTKTGGLSISTADASTHRAWLVVPEFVFGRFDRGQGGKRGNRKERERHTHTEKEEACIKRQR